MNSALALGTTAAMKREINDTPRLRHPRRVENDDIMLLKKRTIAQTAALGVIIETAKKPQTTLGMYLSHPCI